MTGCVFITLREATYGIALTGFRQVISDRGRVLDDLEKMVREDSSGLVFIDERLLDDKTSGRIEVIEKRWPGSIVIIPEPAPEGEERGRKDYGMQLITRVLGYQMKLS